MRQIQSRDAHERKVRRNNFILGFVMVGLLIFSVGGYAFLREDDSKSSGEVNSGFVKQGDKWVLPTQTGDNLYFSYLPNETQGINVSGVSNFESYGGKPVYYVLKNSNEQEEAAMREIFGNVGGFFLRYQEVCLEGVDCEGDLPIKNCSSNVFVFDSSASLSLAYSEENCVYIQGEVERVADAYLYEAFGLR